MFEWWQTLALSLSSLAIGGVIALVSGYVQHRWGEAAARSAEEREAKRSVAEEARRAVREARSKRAEHIYEFLDLSRRYAAHRGQLQTLQAKIEEEISDFPPGTSPDYVRAKVQEIWGMPSIDELWTGFFAAVSTTSSEELNACLVDLLKCVLADKDNDYNPNATNAIRAAEQAVEAVLLD